MTDDVAYQIVVIARARRPVKPTAYPPRRNSWTKTIGQRLGISGRDDFAVRFGYIQNAFRAVFHKRPDQRVDLLVAVVRIRNHQRFARFADFLLDAFD